MQKEKTMKNTDNSWLSHGYQKLIYGCCVAGIGALMSFPVLSQSQSYYPPMSFFQPTAYPNYIFRNPQYDVLGSLENITDSKNLVAEIEAADLTQEFQQQNITVLAPTDEAFNALPDEIIDKLIVPENRLKLLQYHLIARKVQEEDLNKGKIVTSEGQEVIIGSKDNYLTFNNDVRAINKPTIANNGVIIEIDQVLLPPNF